MNANPVLLQKKYVDIIECFAQKAGISLEQALDFFYTSDLYQLISHGVSDMHCMSREYLAEELMYEKDSKVQKKDHFADSEQWVPECKGKKYLTGGR